MTILIRSARLFSEYLGKTRGSNSLLQAVVAYAHVSWWVSCTSGQAHIVQYDGLDGRVHCNYGGLIKLGFMGVGAGISVDA